MTGAGRNQPGRRPRPSGDPSCNWHYDEQRDLHVTEILVLCTANVCRSPMAEAMLVRELAVRGQRAEVTSAGIAGGGTLPVPGEVTLVLAEYGLDMSGHRSRPMTPAGLARADLILALAREHLRHAVVAVPQAWPRAFTLRELARRGAQAGPRAAGETLGDWLARAQAGRSRLALLGDGEPDDVADPFGGPLINYQRAAAQISGAVAQIADLGWGMAAAWSR
jgi:protein-tyrosine phosphatase